MVDEAPLRMSKNGLVADLRGWFVVNARESRWRDAGPLGVFCTFEGKKPFLQLGINISVLEPGQAMGRYHREEKAQEGFLVLSGTCVLIVEGEERTLGPWDFFHCPPGTEHIIVAKETAVVVATGARGRGRGRSALLDGARWWNQAFEAAGYRNAFRVELLPEGVNPLDIRYNVINWVHRSTRGWSTGGSVSDPRTGEIIKGVVTLGSLRIRQDYRSQKGCSAPTRTAPSRPRN